jgi:hypothetical protein
VRYPGIPAKAIRPSDVVIPLGEMMQTPLHDPQDQYHIGAVSHGPPDSDTFVPPHTPPNTDSGGAPERGLLGLLGVGFFVFVAIIMIGMAAGSGAPGWFILVLFAMIVFVVLRFVIVSKSPPAETPAPQQVVKEVHVETIKETVRVRCRYCGSLNLETDTKCQSCGATL